MLPLGTVRGKVTALSLFDSSDWWLGAVADTSEGGKRNQDHDAGLKALPPGDSRKASWCHVALGRDLAAISPHAWIPFLVDGFDGFEGRCSCCPTVSPRCF